MGGAVNLHQGARVDIGVALRGREALMAEKLLYSAQITAPRQQMRRKAMAQRMRRGAIGQAERAAELLHFKLYDTRRQHTAARAAKNTGIWVDTIWVEFSITVHRFRDDRQNRDKPRLAAFARNCQRIS